MGSANQCHQSEQPSRNPQQGDGDCRYTRKYGDQPRHRGQQAAGSDMAGHADPSSHGGSDETARKPQADAQVTHTEILTDRRSHLRMRTRRTVDL